MAQSSRVNQQADELVRAAESLFQSHGFQIVSGDSKLFPRKRPDLAGLKDGRLLIGTVEIFARSGQSHDAAEFARVADELCRMIETNHPTNDPRVNQVECFAVIQTSDSYHELDPRDDVEWVVVHTASDLPDEFERTVFSLGTPGIAS